MPSSHWPQCDPLLPSLWTRSQRPLATGPTSPRPPWWRCRPWELSTAASCAGAARSATLPGTGSFPPLAVFGERARVPYVALLANLVVTLLLLLGSSLNSRVSFGAAGWVFYATTGLALQKLRHDMPGMRRLCRCPFICAGLVVVVAVHLFVTSLLDQSTRRQTIGSLSFVVVPWAGHMAYRLLRAKWASQLS